MELFEVIKNRRSIRSYLDKDIPDEVVDKILEAGRWAPSGFNYQPWKFAVIKDKNLKAELGKLTKYEKNFNQAPVLIAIFLDHEISYDLIKDVQAIGACMQNMWLAVHDLGLGAMWNGEIRKNMDKVRDLCGAPEHYELMGIIAVGYPGEEPSKSSRKPLDDLVFLRK